MQVVGCRRPAPGAVIDEVHPRKPAAEIEHDREGTVDALGDVGAMRDGKVRGEDGIRIAEDQILAERDAVLLRWKMLVTQEAPSLSDRGRIHVG
jgi:hypothetical protein